MSATNIPLNKQDNAFDLKELMNPDMLNKLLASTGKMSNLNITLLTPDGEPFCSVGQVNNFCSRYIIPCQCDDCRRLLREAAAESANSGKTIKKPCPLGFRNLFVPIIKDSKGIGTLAVCGMLERKLSWLEIRKLAKRLNQKYDRDFKRCIREIPVKSEGQIDDILDLMCAMVDTISEMAVKALQRKIADEISLAVNSVLDLNEVMSMLLDGISQIFKFDHGDIILIKSDRELEIAAYKHGNEPAVQGAHGTERVYSIDKGLTGYVARHGTPAVLSDVSKDDKDRYWALEPGTKSEIAMPLKYQDKTIGVLNLESNTPNHYSEKDIDVLRPIIEPAATAIYNALLYTTAQQDLERRVAQLSKLTEVTKQINKTLQPDELFNVILKAGMDLTGADRGSLELVDRDTGNFDVKAVGGSTNLKPGAQFDIKTGIVGWVFEHGEPAIVPNVHEDDRYFSVDEEVQSEMAVPLIYGNKVLGVLNLESTILNYFNLEHLELLKILSEQAAIVIARAKLLAERDERIRRLKAVHESSPTLNEMIEPSRLLPKLAQMINQLMDTDVCSIWELDEDTQKFFMVANDGIDKEAWQFKRLTMDSVTAQTITRGQPQNIPNLMEITNFEQRDMAKELGLKSLLSVPFFLRGKARGAINVHKDIEQHFNDEDLALLTNFANYVSASIEQSRMSLQATTLYTIGTHLSSSFLFSVELKYQIDLEKGDISEDLRQEFENNKVLLSQNVTVSIEDKDSEWLITDRDNKKTYSVRKEENQLSIYSSPDNLDEVWDLVVSEAAKSMEGGGCSLFLLEDGVFKLKATTGLTNKEDEKNAFYEPGEGLTGWIGANGKTLRIFDVRDVDRLKQIDDNLNWENKYSEVSNLDRTLEGPFLGVPIFVEGKSTGVLRVAMKKSGVAFSESYQVILEGIAAQIGAAIHRSRLVDRIEKERKHLADAIRTIGSELNVDKVLRHILNSAKIGTKADLGSIRFYYKETNTLRYVMVEPQSRWDEMEESEVIVEPNIKSIGVKVLLTREPYVCPNVHEDQLWSGCFPEAKSCVVVPITYRDDKIGVICMDSPELNAFDDDDRELLSLLGVQAAVAIKNARVVEELQRAYEELQRVDEAKNAYMQDVTHQLVAPIQGILGHAENLLHERYEEDQYETILEHLVETSQACARMAQNFAYIPGEEASKDELNLRRRAVTPLLIIVARSFQGKAKSNNININVDEHSTDSLPELNLDRQTFIQAASNIVDNAVKYSDPDTTITIRAKRRGNQALLHFENFGIPIPKGKEERIFDRYYRTDEAKRRAPTGTGIGLEVARDIIQLHGGELKAKPSTKVSKGFKTVFTITLPIPQGKD